MAVVYAEAEAEAESDPQFLAAPGGRPTGFYYHVQTFDTPANTARLVPAAPNAPAAAPEAAPAEPQTINPYGLYNPWYNGLYSGLYGAYPHSYGYPYGAYGYPYGAGYGNGYGYGHYNPYNAWNYGLYNGIPRIVASAPTAPAAAPEAAEE